MLLTGQKNIIWTDHVKAKMRQYRLSPSRLMRILRHPRRLEIGVAPDTVAGMQPAGSQKHPYELWVMWVASKQPKKSRRKFNLSGQRITIISAWRYPGVSPIHEPPPIPDDVWEIVRRERK
jgi:hypothetical protein